MISDLNFIVIIDRLLDDDAFAIINNQSEGSAANNRDFGFFFDLMKGSISHHLTNIDAITKLTFTINSRVEQQFQNELNGDALLRAQSGLIQNGGQSNLLDEFRGFVSTLVGRPLKVIEITDTDQIVKFDGFIALDPGTISAQSGTLFTLVGKTKLGQLSQMSSNGSWQDATQSYGNIFTGLSANQINFDNLIDDLFTGTLLEGVEYIQPQGNANPIPDKVWAVILPNKMRIDVIQEILIPYSRIIFQKEDGTISIQPLFVDDTADEVYSINCFNNYNATWIGFNAMNAASTIPNRMDVLWGIAMPYDQFGDGSVPNEDIFCSTPKIDKSTNKILPLNIEDVIDYATVYKTSARLYNSGKFIMPIMETLNLDSSLILNASLLNAVLQLYDTKDFIYSNIYVSGDTQLNGIALLYSQIFMAQINIKNYNATITYDYLRLKGAQSPLGKIVTINNASNIDYKDMLVMGTSLDFDADRGTLYTIDTCPLLSITGVWSKLNG